MTNFFEKLRKLTTICAKKIKDLYVRLPSWVLLASVKLSSLSNMVLIEIGDKLGVSLLRCCLLGVLLVNLRLYSGSSNFSYSCKHYKKGTSSRLI